MIAFKRSLMFFLNFCWFYFKKGNHVSLKDNAVPIWHFFSTVPKCLFQRVPNCLVSSSNILTLNSFLFVEHQSSSNAFVQSDDERQCKRVIQETLLAYSDVQHLAVARLFGFLFWVPNVASFSGFSILDCPFDFV